MIIGQNELQGTFLHNVPKASIFTLRTSTSALKHFWKISMETFFSDLLAYLVPLVGNPCHKFPSTKSTICYVYLKVATVIRERGSIAVRPSIYFAQGLRFVSDSRP